MIMPLGTYMTPNRLIGLAAVFCRADSAGIMLSSRGNASIDPRPRKAVRRGIVFFAMIMIDPSYVSQPSTQRTQRTRRIPRTQRQSPVHLFLCALVIFVVHEGSDIAICSR